MKIKEITAVLLGLCGAFAFAACKDEPATTNDDTPTTTPAPAHTHTFATEWSKDETHHWYACTGSGCTEVSEKAEHAFDDGEITTAATKDQDGVKTFTCEACGATKTEPVEYVPDTEVTAEEWATALALNFDNYTLQATMKQSENIISEVLTQYADGLLYQNADGEETYFQNDNENYYQYLQEDDEWHKYKSSEEDYNKRVKPNLIGNFSYDEFTYNAGTEKYETSSIESSVIHFTYVSVSFLDNKAQSLTFMIQEERGVVYNYKFSYGDAEITLPQVVPSKKIKDDNMLANAFTAAFAMQDNGEYAVGMDSLKNMTYIEAGGYYTYTAVYNEEHNLQADYQAYFLDGKLVKLEVFIDGVKTYVFTYDYEVEEI